MFEQLVNKFRKGKGKGKENSDTHFGIRLNNNKTKSI